MIVYFADRALHILGQASTELPRGMTITADLKTEDVETGVAVFECRLPFQRETRALTEQCAKAGNYLLRSHDGQNEFYTIIETEVDAKKQEVYLYAEDAGLDLLNEVCGPYEADQAYPISHYIQKFAYDSGFEIGVNEVPGLNRKLKWEGEATATERIASVATQFDGCEISYSFAISGLAVTHKYINIYRQRGKEIGANLRLNYEVDNVVQKTSIANLATALLPTGGTPEGAETPIHLDGYAYDDGDIYLEGNYLKSRKALERWSRYRNAGEPNQTYTGHILKTYTYDTTVQSTLCAHAVTRLKKICVPEVNYEIELASLPKHIALGDRVNIIDDAGALYLSARVLQLETSVADRTQKATLGEYLLRDDGISEHVRTLAERFSALTWQTASATAKAQATAEAAQADAIAGDAEIRAAMAAQGESNMEAAGAMVEAAAENYAKSGEYAAFRDTTELQFQTLEDALADASSTANAQLQDVGRELQGKYSELREELASLKDGLDQTDRYTGTMVVPANQRAQFGNFALIPRSDGSLMFLKVGG